MNLWHFPYLNCNERVYLNLIIMLSFYAKSSVVKKAKRFQRTKKQKGDNERKKETEFSWVFEKDM